MKRFDRDDNRVSTWLLAGFYVTVPAWIVGAGLWKTWELLVPRVLSLMCLGR